MIRIWGEAAKMKRLADRARIADCVFLFCLIMLAAFPYLFKLGFYIDDWFYHSVLVQSSGHGLGASFRAMSLADQNLLMRPVQLAYLVLSFKAFGLHALPYHVVNTMVLGLVTVLLYLTATELNSGRRLAFAIAIVFGCLPHYSTDRIWMSSQQATLCMAFAFLGICALLKSVRVEGEHRTAWAFLAFLALALSILSYEPAFGMIAASLGVIGWKSYRNARASSRLVLMRVGGIACTAAVLLLIIWAKLQVEANVSYHHHLFTHFWALVWHSIVQAFQFNLWTYFLHMPAVLSALYRHAALSYAAAATATVLFFLVTAYLWLMMRPSEIPNWRTCLWLVVVGFGVFILGNGLFFADITANFSSMGLSNRVVIGSAPGAACVLVAIAGLMCSVLKSDVGRVRVFACAMGIICAVNSLVVSGIASFWADASIQQNAILRSVSANVRSLPHGSVLLLDGFCRYAGPGIVLEGGEDASGAIQLTLGDFTLSGDVISPNVRFGDTTAESIIYGQVLGHYPYGNRLFVYNVQSQSLTSLPSKEAAISYLSALNPTGDGGCPAGREGEGSQIF
jgi:hypothetical protein